MGPQDDGQRRGQDDDGDLVALSRPLAVRNGGAAESRAPVANRPDGYRKRSPATGGGGVS